MIANRPLKTAKFAGTTTAMVYESVFLVPVSNQRVIVCAPAVVLKDAYYNHMSILIKKERHSELLTNHGSVVDTNALS